MKQSQNSNKKSLLKIFTRKKGFNQNPKTPITLPFSKAKPIARKAVKPKRRRSVTSILSWNKKKSKGNLKTNRQSGIKFTRFTKTLLASLFILLVTAVLYASIQQILKIRQTRFVDEIDLTKEVYAIEGVPVFTGSEFIFENMLDNEIVQKTLTSGISAYRLPPNSDAKDVQEFYDTHLPQLGWDKMQEVELNDPTMLTGQYWSKGNVGLRIYSRLNDIWYEKISIDEAVSGLSDRKAELIEREKILSEDEEQLLLPSFPWHLRISKEYLIDYTSTDFDDGVGVTFTQLISNRKSVFEPIGFTGKEPDDTMVENFLDRYNLQQDEQDTDLDEWEISSSAFVLKNSYDSLQVTFTNGGASTVGFTLRNQLDGYTYLLVSFDNDTEFVEYFLANVIDKATLSPDQQLKIFE